MERGHPNAAAIGRTSPSSPPLAGPELPAPTADTPSRRAACSGVRPRCDWREQLVEDLTQGPASMDSLAA